MKKLTRYTLVVRRDSEGFASACAKVRREGEWVKFSDVMEALTKAPNNARDENYPCGECDHMACTTPQSCCAENKFIAFKGFEPILRDDWGLDVRLLW